MPPNSATHKISTGSMTGEHCTQTETGKGCSLADMNFTVAAVEITTLFSGSISMSFRRLSSYSELGIPGVRSSFLTA